jgi:hypothetical protein
MSSSALLLFTKDGIHFQRRVGERWRTHSEGPMSRHTRSINEPLSVRDMIRQYTKRTLTYPNDVLRAFSGILHAKHGERTSFGIPWDDFDRVLHWAPFDYTCERRASFPSWSWTSISGHIGFLGLDSIYSFAYWAIPAVDVPMAPANARWVPIEGRGKGTYEASHAVLEDWEKARRVVAALAWLNGCIRTDVPQSLGIDCSAAEYRKRMSERWPAGSLSFRHEAFDDYAKESVFEGLSAEMPGASRQLAVHTQSAFFHLDRDRMGPDHPDYSSLVSGCNQTIIRLSNNRIAGSINLDAHAAQTLSLTHQRQGQFIALSTCGEFYGGNNMINISLYGYILQRPSQHISPSIFYGCPCSVEKDSTLHVVECPMHADFYRPDYAQELSYGRNQRFGEVHDRAFLNHLTDVSYFDVHGALLHYKDYVPTLKVMLVIPNTEGNGGYATYKRLGIGNIHLKRWVEASPTFETIVLE